MLQILHQDLCELMGNNKGLRYPIYVGDKGKMFSSVFFLF